MLILLLILLFFAFAGFGHTGYRRGWYGRGYGPDYAPVAGGWGGSGLGLILLILALLLLFGGHHHAYY